MTTIEIIKAEIERLIEESDFDESANLYSLLSFLDTLESEKQPQEGLDVTDFCKPIDPGIAQCIADHSWEMLGEDEKPMQDGLEEEIDKVYLPNRVVGYVQGIGKILLGREAFANIARHFAKWGADHFRDLTKKPGDKVRIIIVKEDEK